MTRKLILTGPRAGKTVVLRRLKFVDGRVTLSGSPDQWEGIVRYMARTYRAFEEGTEALAQAQACDEALRVEYQTLCNVYKVKMQRDRAGRPDPFCRHARQLRDYHQERTHGQCEVHTAPESGPPDSPPGAIQPSGRGPAAGSADDFGGDDAGRGGDARLRPDGSIEHSSEGPGEPVRPVPASETKLKAVKPKPSHAAT